MIQRVYPPTTRWVGTFPARRYIFRGQLASIPPMRPISFSSVNMGRPRPRPSGSYRRPSVTVRVEGRNRSLPVGQIVGYASLMVAGYTVYSGYKLLKSAAEIPGEMVGGVRSAIQEKIPEKLGHVAKGAQDLLNTVQASVGPSLSKASEELPKTIQTASGAIGAAAGGAKTVMASRWEWLKKEVGERRK